MTRFASAACLVLFLVASAANAQPKRDTNTNSPFAPIIKAIRHLIGLDDPTPPKP